MPALKLQTKMTSDATIWLNIKTEIIDGTGRCDKEDERTLGSDGGEKKL